MQSRNQDWELPKIRRTLFGVLIIRILLFRVLCLGPLFSETPGCWGEFRLKTRAARMQFELDTLNSKLTLRKT